MLNWLDGRKTIIGACCLFTGAVLTEVVSGFWGFNPEWMEPTIKTANWFGIVSGGPGLVHKGYKKATKKAEKAVR